MPFDLYTGGYLTSNGMSNTVDGKQPPCKHGHLHRADEWIHFESTTGTTSIYMSDDDVVKFCDTLLSIRKTSINFVKINSEVSLSVIYDTGKHLNFDFGMNGSVFIFVMRKKFIKNLVKYLLLEVGATHE